MRYTIWSLSCVASLLSRVTALPAAEIAAGHDVHTDSQDNTDFSNLQMSPAVLTDETLTQSLSNRPVHLTSQVGINYRAVCPGNRITRGNFIVGVMFNGKNAYYSKVQNIDNFGRITLVGHGQPYYSTAQYHHTICKPLDATTICSYYHFGTVTADITVLGGKEKGITMDMIRQGEGRVEQRPYVIQTCARRNPNRRDECPPPDFTAPRCNMDPIMVSTFA